tara:strand:+ start:224 stop:532 length:309 start_codon:yes stop_codon:yes gene_type:complete
MPQRLTVAQQRSLYKALPANRKMAVKKTCHECEMRGDGFMDILRKVGKTLGHIGKEIGPTVLKEIIAPILVKRYTGKGLNLPGGSMRGRPRMVKTMPKKYKR